MAQPKAYQPKEGFQFQLLFRLADEREFEHCDYAKDEVERDKLVQTHGKSYGNGLVFKAIPLPKKYWKKPEGWTNVTV
ncbi:MULTISPECIES: hypothetical protein [Paenibacillus]|uniref:hypothetical protein n=1 Tax=Paenibacillus TaxID=44249 RepID=UPI000F537B9C|nr:hypothetical protein [Paenibacillus xylanexedens]RPK20115.1 hypothetical protein EDO6_06654 [Paenibacillus xylanexedens]